MHQKAQTRATRCRVQNVLFATLALAIVSGFVGWRGLSSPVIAKSADVPFRLMEATTGRRRPHSRRALSPRSSSSTCTWRALLRTTAGVRPSTR